MTAVPDIPEFQSAGMADNGSVLARPYKLEEAYWGYVIHGSRDAPLGLVVAQVASWVVGTALAAVAVGLWAMSPEGGTEGLALFKLGASLPAAAAAILLIWFASRGMTIELQIDTNQGEIREVLRNRAGRTTLLSLHGFDSIGGVFLLRDPQKAAHGGDVRLVLRHRNTSQVMQVAEGPEVMLEILRDRLGRDLMVKRSRAGRIATEAVAGLSRAA